MSGTQAIVGYEALILAGPLDLSGSLDVASYFYGTGEILVQPAWFFELDVPYESALTPELTGEITFTYTYGVPEPPGLVLASIAAILPLYLIVERNLTVDPSHACSLRTGAALLPCPSLAASCADHSGSNDLRQSLSCGMFVAAV